MRHVWLMPLTFIAGPHGFALFAPYLLLVLTALYLRRMRKSLKVEVMPELVLVPALAG